MKKKTLQIGLDIGAYSVKLVQLSGEPDNLLLTRFDVRKVQEKTDEGYKKLLTDMAQTLATKEVNISISGPAVVVRYIELPKMTDEELKDSMKFEAEKYIPFKINEVILDCQTLEYLEHNKMRVLLAAAKKSAVSNRLRLVQEAGLSAGVIDCDAFALINAFVLNFPDDIKEGNTALIDLGEKLTNINILRGKAPYFTRELEIGGRDFSKVLAEKLNLDIKSASGLVEEPKERFEEVMEAIKPIRNHMIEEIRLSLNYYENQMGIGVDRIYLSGGLSSLRGFKDMFAESLGIDCRLWDPFKSLKIEKDLPLEKLNSVKNQLPVALGLAMRG